MWPNISDWFDRNDPKYQKAVEDGFRIAQSYFQKATREFYRGVKKGMLKDMATLSTATTHKCNCEFCWTNEPKQV